MFRAFLLSATLLIGFTATPLLFAQDEIEQIISRNPFDPDRGVEEEEPEAPPEPEPVEVVNEEHGMILDGTIMFSKSQMAIITIDKPAVTTGNNGSTGVRRVGARRGRPITRRNRANFRRNLAGGAQQEEEESKRPTGPETHTVYVGDELEGYELMSVTSSTAVLRKGNETIKLALFSGEKENRGGSKELNTVAKPAEDSDARPRAQRVPGGDPNPRANEEKKEDSPMKVPERKFEKRERPKMKRSGSSSNFKM